MITSKTLSALRYYLVNFEIDNYIYIIYFNSY